MGQFFPRLRAKYHDDDCHSVHPNSTGDDCRYYGRSRAIPPSELIISELPLLRRLPHLVSLIGCHPLVTSFDPKLKTPVTKMVGQGSPGSRVHASAELDEGIYLSPKPSIPSQHLLDYDSPEQLSGSPGQSGQDWKSSLVAVPGEALPGKLDVHKVSQTSFMMSFS